MARKDFELKTLDLNFKDSKSSFSEDEEYFHFSGYGAVFGNVDRGNDIITSGAFTNSLKEMQPKLCYQHRMDEPLGVIDAKEDAYGLFVSGKMPKANSQVKDVAALIKCGAIDSMSIGYRTIKSDYNSETEIRHLNEVKLYEVSFVTIPMNPAAKVTDFKSEDGEEIPEIEEIKSVRDAEAVLKAKGFSVKEAKTLISKIKESGPCDEGKEETQELGERDADPELEEVKNLATHLSEVVCVLKLKSLTH